MYDFSKIKSPIIFKGDSNCAYRDPAVCYENGVFHLFCTYVDNRGCFPYLTTMHSRSSDLVNWTAPEQLTVRDTSLNFSSPGNVIKKDGIYYLCLQTYCRENGEKYGNDNCRIWVIKSCDLENWTAPELLKVKGDIPVSRMGRMIDPYFVEDINEEGKWWCLYKQNGVSMSYSYDLKNWTFSGYTESGENVCVITKENSDFRSREYLIFHSPQNGIGILRSQNLVDFEDTGILITLGQNSWNWAKGRLTAGFVLDLKNNCDFGKYIMFFHGSGPENEEIMFDNNASIGIAWSDDLENWEYPL